MRDDPFRFADELGPTTTLHLTERTTGLRATVVVDNVAVGPAIGGVRIAPDVSTEECFGLARAMTLKNALAGLRHGGGKAVIAADHRMPTADKERLMRAFARAIADVTDYIPGPDMGSNEDCMAWVHDEIGRAVGLPAVLGGIPLDDIGATGFGLAASIDVAAGHLGLDLEGARVAVQGFGAVGRHVARFLARRGCVLVGVADSAGALVNPHGLDVEELISAKATGSVVEHGGGEVIDRDAIVGVDCDIWIPAARPNVLHRGNVDAVTATIVAQGANIPATPEAELRLRERGVLVLPDVVANAGGVVCAAVEYAGGTQTDAIAAIDELIRANTATVLERSVADDIAPREAALSIAHRRIEDAMRLRRFR